MNTTNRFLLPPKQRRFRLRSASSLFWAGTMVFTGVLLAVLYCLLTGRVPV